MIIDVREKQEFETGHVDGAVNIPLMELMSSLPKELDDTNKDEEVICYCASGGRSAAAIQMLQQHGFTKLVNGINQANVESML